ncbi:MAG: MFS transporter [Rhizomicrobium sp.]
MREIPKNNQGRDETMTLEPIAEAALQIAPAPRPSSLPWPSPRVAWYAVFVFSLTLMINFLDRGIVPLLVPSIKADLHLTDFQMSLLMGFAFIMFYVFLGLPVARYADVGIRRTIVGVGIGLWSLATAFCGLASTFWQFFAARVGTGVGESCGGPATYSMLSDLFPPEKLPRAIAVMSFGFMAGTGLSLIIGGAIVQLLIGIGPQTFPLLGLLKPWQMTFLLVGLPGLLVSAMLWTIPEPVRRGRAMGEAKGGRPASIPLSSVIKYLYDHRSVYGTMLLGLAFSTTLSIGTLSWGPAFYGRTYGWSMGQVGLITGLVILVVWPPGAMFGSWLAERWAKQGKHDANLRVVLWTMCLLIPGHIAFPLMPTAETALAVSAVNGFISAWLLGPQNAAVQIVTPNEMRGQFSALTIFIINVLGYGLGPTLIATLTDDVFGREADLRYAMASAATVLGPLAAFMIWRGLRPYGAMVERVSKTW